MEERIKENRAIKIAIVGVESSGKTTLCRALAEKFNSNFTVEVSRDYLSKLTNRYTASDIEKISELQLIEEAEQLKKSNSILFCDTTLLVNKIWHEVVFRTKSKLIDHLYTADDYDLHILCDIDIPWEYDVLRENPAIDERRSLFELYEGNLKKEKSNYIVASGNLEERVRACSELIQKIKPT
jgi:nicotinamide riboside kinase